MKSMSNDPGERAEESTAKSGARVIAVVVAIAGGVLLHDAATEEGTPYFAIGLVLFVSALVAARAPSLFWVPRPGRHESSEPDEQRPLETQRARR